VLIVVDVVVVGFVIWLRRAYGLEVGIGLPRQKLFQDAVQSRLELVLGHAVARLLTKPEDTTGELKNRTGREVP